MNEDKTIIEKVIEVVDDTERKRRKPFWFWFIGGSVILTAIGALGFITLLNSSPSVSLTPTSNSVPTSSTPIETSSSSTTTPSSSSSSSTASSVTPSSSSSTASSIANVTITFNTNGGTAITAITAQPGSAITAPANPTRSNYTFAGWFSNEGLTTAYTIPSTMPSASITLYAKWTGNAYSISYSYRTMQAPRFQKLSTGETHSIGLNTNGQVYSWGSNEFGNIGNGTTSYTPTHPTLISFPAGETIRDVVAGQFSNFAVTSNGQVYAWGLNDVGQLGDNSIVNRVNPKLISFPGLNQFDDGETIKNVVADEYHSLAVTTTGRVYAWGKNNFGQLGDNSTLAKRIPTLISFPGLNQFDDGETIKNVAAGGAIAGASSFMGGGHSLAVTTTGRVYAWGRNASGQLGDGTTANKSTPTLISLPGINEFNNEETIKNVTAGGDYSHAVTTTGRVYSWGYNNLGQLGDGTKTNRSTPTLISFPGINEFNNEETIRNIHIGSLHSVAVTTAGRVYAWGWNIYGQLGDNTTTDKSSPTLISFTGLGDGEKIEDVFAGSAHSLAVTTNNRLYAWGFNSFGQLGDKTTVNKLIPTPVFDLTTTLVNNYHTVNYGDTITSTLPNPTLAGHTFVGWFMDEALTVQYNLTTMPAENVILYASFTPTT